MNTIRAYDSAVRRRHVVRGVSTNLFIIAGMLRHAPSIKSDPQLGADGHVPVIGGRSGDVQSLWALWCSG